MRTPGGCGPSGRVTGDNRRARSGAAQIEDLKNAVLAADHGNFATDAQVAAALFRHDKVRVPVRALKPGTRRSGKK